MTREEAIRWLEDIHRRFNPTGENLENEGGDVHLQALDMAIEALSAPQNNLISREDAVKTVIRKCSPICAWQVGTQQYPDCVVAEINALPSAEAEWIPCSEKLPEKEELVLVTVWNDVTIAWRNIYGGWDSAEDMYEKGDVIAWMPLPKPYREDGEA